MADTQEYPTSPPRINLKPFEGKRLKFTGKVEKYSDILPCYGRPYYTACIQKVCCEKHDISFDHVWIRVMPHQLKNIQEGKHLCFSGEVREYLRGYHKMQFTHEWIDWSVDFGLVNVEIVLPKSNVKKIGYYQQQKVKTQTAQLIKPKWMNR